MKKQVAGLLPLLAAVAFQSADAQTILSTGGGSLCGGSNYFGCFNAALTFDDPTNTFQLTITNTGAGVFTQIGVGALSTSNNQNNPSFTYTGGSVTAPGGTSFGGVITNPNGLSGGTIDRPVIGIDAGGNDGLAAGGTAVFSFMITSADNTFDLSAVQIAVHQQGGSPNQACGGSTKIVLARTSPTASGGTMIDNTTNPLCDDPPGGGGTGSVVPEPATYALMGTGLLGLGLVSSFRRRRTS